MSATDDDSYPVGYRRPPIKTRFAAGQSGNPKGRPRGSKNMLTVLNAELDSRVTVTENGKRKTVTKRQVMAKQLVNKAAGGDLKAIPIVLGHALAHEQMQASATALQETLSHADRISMDSIMARIRGTPAFLIETGTAVEVANTVDDSEGEGPP